MRAIRAGCLAFEQAVLRKADNETAFRSAVSQYRLFRPSAPEQEVRDMISLGLPWEMLQRLRIRQ
jgi:hypothetical protein